MARHLLFLTIPLLIGLALFLIPERQNKADGFLAKELATLQSMTTEELQRQLHTNPIIEGFVLWDQSDNQIFPVVGAMVHISQQPYLSDIKRLESLRHEANPTSTEVKSKNADTHYWCQSLGCLAVNGPALSDALGKPHQNHHNIFQPTSYRLLFFIVVCLMSGLAAVTYHRLRKAKENDLFPKDGDAFDFGPVRISPARMLAMTGTHTSDLTARDLKLILLMYQNQGFVLSKDQLYDAGWGRDFMPNSRALEQHMLTLRKKLDPDRTEGTIIETVHGQGYRFNG